ncbi:mycothiol synthase [Corynebacterium macginleyi]|uniref:Mycothiol acetyltransferase n=2 Tax=Corynebacterium macginleyi TaxID=38290 RepID=A0A3M0GC86_9CORY|nr:mycothiol synthase [Corynebacterium macginleyi]MBK4156412.1 mycothiol synthase [Corynebacterium macginleyi]MBK4162201.1 mycothiol synthase [Corynebacterium macginleyi]MBK4162477.1 mycothiol synthase [Corynebacterium macginleyi]MBK4181514.1 mycothiol synthase [Corynebacterium macginleyi]
MHDAPVDFDYTHTLKFSLRIMSTMNITEENLPASPELASSLEELAALTEKADGIAPLSEQFLNGLRDERLHHEHLVAWIDGNPIGVSGRKDSTAELFIAPDYRGKGYGTALYDATAHATTNLEIWAHGNGKPAQALASSRALTVTRTLVVMSIDGSDLESAAHVGVLPLQAVDYSEAVDKWGKDTVDKEWLRVNNEAFSWHPEQGGWDLERLHRGMEADWLDPRDVLFFWDENTQGHPVLAGFHWAKWHEEEDPGFGEVYVVGLAEAYRGRKLGGPLLQIGLQRMVEKGAQRVILYVEADNEPALKAYKRLGFCVDEEHVVWGQCD